MFRGRVCWITSLHNKSSDRSSGSACGVHSRWGIKKFPIFWLKFIKDCIRSSEGNNFQLILFCFPFVKSPNRFHSYKWPMCILFSRCKSAWGHTDPQVQQRQKDSDQWCPHSRYWCWLWYKLQNYWWIHSWEEGVHICLRF